MNPLTPSTRPRLLLVCPGKFDGRETLLADDLATVADVTLALPDGTKAGGRRAIGLDGLAAIPAGERPDTVVYASLPTRKLHWKIWCWKRIHAPGALLGGHWPAPGSDDGWWARLAICSLDFFFAADEAGAEALARVGIHRRRVRRDDAGSAGAFVVGRLAARERSVLWVDEDVSLHSPSTKHLVYSLPHLQAEGWEVSAWCLTTDAPADALEVRRLPLPPVFLRILTAFWFPAVAGGRGLARRWFKGRKEARIVHTVGGNYLRADLVAVQFINALWLRKQRELGVRGFKAAVMLFFTGLGALKDALQFRRGRCRLYLPASDSIGEEVRQRCRPQAAIRTLPNSYDETRFNPDVRTRWREPMRAELGFGADDTVFVFASQGHHERKGFWLAVEGLERVRRRGDAPRVAGAKFLVVGGLPGTLDRLRARLTVNHPGWEKWLVFVGTQSAVERYLAAADAFLFPSYFEAFCLAEIEAGAMGLPLLLTPHHGTEMILRPGENGLTLPFDPAEIEAVLADFLREGLPPFAPGAGRGLDRQGYARELAAIYRDFIARDTGK